MNANERNWKTPEVTAGGAAAPLARRRFITWCALLTGGALGLGGRTVAAPADIRHGAPGVRERSLAEADFYRPHDLAG